MHGNSPDTPGALSAKFLGCLDFSGAKNFCGQHVGVEAVLLQRAITDRGWWEHYPWDEGVLVTAAQE